MFDISLHGFPWGMKKACRKYWTREIADDIVNIDRGMRWGFAYEGGPFEAWDAMGVAKSVARMKDEGMEVPAVVETMLEAGDQLEPVEPRGRIEQVFDVFPAHHDEQQDDDATAAHQVKPALNDQPCRGCAGLLLV